MKVIKSSCLAATLIAGLGWGNASNAEGKLQLEYRSTAGALPARLADGQVLGQGRIIFRSPHGGFRVKAEHPLSGQLPGHFVLEGAQDKRHQLRVRVEQKDGQPDRDEGKSIVIPTGEETVFFNVVVDGAQQAPADQYPVTLKADVLRPAPFGGR